MRNLLFLIILNIFMINVSSSAAPSPSYRFTVVPQFPPTQIYKEWQPLIKQISADTGLTLELKIPSSIPKFEAIFLSGQTDFAYLNPYHAVMAWYAQKFQPLIRDTKLLTGILVVRKDGPNAITELAEKVVGFPAPNAFGASLYMRALLKEKMNINIEPRYLETHSNVYRNIIVGKILAGGGVNATFNTEPATVKEQLRIIYETPGVAPHPIVAHPSVPAADHQKIIAAFIKLNSNPQGQALLNAVRIPTPIIADYERDYRPLEELKIEKYVVKESE